jgi:hypothetical protein
VIPPKNAKRAWQKARVREALTNEVTPEPNRCSEFRQAEPLLDFMRAPSLATFQRAFQPLSSGEKPGTAGRTSQSNQKQNQQNSSL